MVTHLILVKHSMLGQVIMQVTTCERGREEGEGRKGEGGGGEEREGREGGGRRESGRRRHNVCRYDTLSIVVLISF